MPYNQLKGILLVFKQGPRTVIRQIAAGETIAGCSDMKFQIVYDEKTSSFRINLSGKFNAADLETCYQAIFKQPKWQKGSNILWDAQKSTFEHLKHFDMTSIAAMTNKYGDKRGNGIAAWVMGREVDYGIGRMFEIINENKVVYDFRLFKTIADAEECMMSSAKRMEKT